MIEMELAHGDLAQMRFAHSPARELVASLRTLQDRRASEVYRRWLSQVGQRLDGVNIALLMALAPAGPLMPSFVMPPPTKPWGGLDDDLNVVVSTPPAKVRADLEHVAQGASIPTVLRPLYDDPAGQLPVLVDELHKYWLAAIEPIWRRLRALAAADLVYRSEQFASHGLGNVLSNLHVEVSLLQWKLRINTHHHCRHRHDLAGTGMVLIPCAFLWPTLIVECCDSPPSLTYPVRGVAELHSGDGLEEIDALSDLVGRTRAALLALLDLPRTTTQLAEQLALSPAAISQHLKILKSTGLAAARRHGRLVLYQRTPAATALLRTVNTRVA